ncbi:MAG: hypothetical protein GC190_20180 [Alphaproteobacteria bacterium]|nr:hypothetical protein [Alphaproteobacteria bacterium]
MKKKNPKYFHTAIDANALDPVTPERKRDAARLLELSRKRAISLILPYSVRKEFENRGTPEEIRRAAGEQIFTIETERTLEEEARASKILAVLQGNAKAGRHDADAGHIAELEKYGGGYFITYDDRIRDRQSEWRQFAPSVEIVTLEEYMTIFDEGQSDGTKS